MMLSETAALMNIIYENMLNKIVFSSEMSIICCKIMQFD